LFKNSFEKEFLNKEHVSLKYIKKFFYNIFLLNHLKNIYSIQKSLSVIKLIFSKRRIKFYLKKFKRLNFKRMLYKNILRNKIYFIFLKYILFLRIFLYKKNKRKMITCNKISYKYFNFFYKLKYYKKNPFKFKILKKKTKKIRKNKKFSYFFLFFLFFFPQKRHKKKYILKIWRIFDKRLDNKNYLKTLKIQKFKNIIKLNKFLCLYIKIHLIFKKLN
jgi:hypothetical protein